MDDTELGVLANFLGCAFWVVVVLYFYVSTPSK